MFMLRSPPKPPEQCAVALNIPLGLSHLFQHVSNSPLKGWMYTNPSVKSDIIFSPPATNTTTPLPLSKTTLQLLSL
eukprot:8426049-Pyramimonas_sp.AAC.2